MGEIAAPMRLGAISIYPVKSCRGITLDRARVERRGLARDRRWMIVDAAGRFVTQRDEPRLSLVDVALVDAPLERAPMVLSAPGAGSITIDRHDEGEGPAIDVIVWGDVVSARVHAGGSAWVSGHLGRDVRLVSMPESTRRAVSPKHAVPGDLVSFADGFPLLLASRASLDDLNARLAGAGEAPLGMERFRPNVVVLGAPAWDEDRWSRLRIGGVSFRAPKPCARCVITTIDPSTAIAGKEPLRTLATFRRRGEGVMFGVNLIPDLAEGETAELAVGEIVVPEVA